MSRVLDNIGKLQSGRKNYIINGNFDIWQRGTSQTSAGYGSDDRWVNHHNGSTKTHSQQAFTLGQTDVPNEPKYFSRTVVTSVAGAANYCDKSQKIESVRTLAGKTATLSFYAKADAAKNIAVAFSQYFGTGGSPSTAINDIGVTTCALTTAWQKFTITVNLPSIAGKTLGTNNDDALLVAFYFDAGSNYNALTNSLGQQSGTFDIAQVQLEEGSVATNFEYRPIGEELALCQRYYEKLSSAISLAAYVLSSVAGDCMVEWKTQKRSIPSVGISTGADDFMFQFYEAYYIPNAGYINVYQSSTFNARCRFMIASGTPIASPNGTAGLLVITGASAYIYADAEL